MTPGCTSARREISGPLQWPFGMKCHIGAEADCALVHTVAGTPANVNGVTQAGKLLHGAQTDAGYQGVTKREDTQGITAQWHVAMRPGKRRALDKSAPLGAILHKLEQAKARIRPRENVAKLASRKTPDATPRRFCRALPIFTPHSFRRSALRAPCPA